MSDVPISRRFASAGRRLGYNVLSMLSHNLDIPEDALKAVQLDPQAAAADVRIAAAMKLFNMGRLSSGTAARLAGVCRVEFLDRLAEFGVNAFDMTEDELASDCGNV